VALLRAKLRPAPPEPADLEQRVRRWLAELEDEQFAVRQKAAAGLAALDLRAAPALRERLRVTDSEEARRAITRLLDQIDQWVANPQRLREVRAVEALQRNATPEARKLLEELATGDASARLTHEARASLRGR
jgi:hypothetical protein